MRIGGYLGGMLLASLCLVTSVSAETEKKSGPLKMIQELAEKGSAKMQASLAGLYAKGEGLSQDYKEAAKWFERAADQGHTDAQAALADLYSQGKGVEKDLKKAYMHLTVLAQDGEKSASKMRDKIAESMSSEQIEEAEKMASEWIEQHTN